MVNSLELRSASLRIGFIVLRGGREAAYARLVAMCVSPPSPCANRISSLKKFDDLLDRSRVD